MVRTKEVNRPKITNRSDFPKKDKSSITIVQSENPLWEYEAYCYRGLFIGYLGPSDINPLSKDKQISDNNINDKDF